MQSCIKHLLKHFAFVLKAKLNQLKPFVRFVFQSSTLPHPHIHRIIKGLHIQTLFMLLYASFSCPYLEELHLGTTDTVIVGCMNIETHFLHVFYSLVQLQYGSSRIISFQFKRLDFDKLGMSCC